MSTSPNRSLQSSQELKQGDIIQFILERHAAGETLLAKKLNTGEEFARKMYRAALDLFPDGKWEEALAAAGLNPREHRERSPHYTAESLKEEILYRYRTGQSLRSSEVGSGIRNAANNFYGSLDGAIRAAELDPTETRGNKRWFRKDVEQAIQARAAAGKPLNAKSVQQEEGHLYKAARNHFDSWLAALAELGYDPSLIEQQRSAWTPDEILDVVKERRTEGLPLYSTAVKRELSGLFSAAERFFGSWDQTLRQARINPHDVRKALPLLDKEAVVERIGKLHKMGIPLHSSSIQGEYPRLHKSAIKVFGKNGWEKALQCAGIPPEDIRRKAYDWNRVLLVSDIRRRQREGEPLQAGSVPRAMLAAAKRHWGSWDNLLIAAELNPEEIRKRWEWDEEKVIQKIQQLDLEGLPLNATAVDPRLRQAAITIFDGWDLALEEAGVDPAQHSVLGRSIRFGNYFDEIARSIFAELRPDWDQGYRHEEEGTAYRAQPDCVAPNGEWIDFKLCSHGWSAQKSSRNYGPFAPRLSFIYLHGFGSHSHPHEVESIFEHEHLASTPSSILKFELCHELLHLWKQGGRIDGQHWKEALNDWSKKARAQLQALQHTSAALPPRTGTTRPLAAPSQETSPKTLVPTLTRKGRRRR